MQPLSFNYLHIDLLKPLDDHFRLARHLAGPIPDRLREDANSDTEGDFRAEQVKKLLSPVGSEER